ncbi:MAG: fimbria/pilus periplasmic chaperone [Pseudomonadota bacterium]|nr:fimbria/pilus periplasmic chaperone [Pseudomonadota bacterium]
MRTLAVALLISAAMVAPASASTFNISPIRAELTNSHRTEALTITNAEDSPVVVQVRVVVWSQKGGTEQLDDTRELLATPPVLQIAANSQQIVRVALRREPDPALELTYRVIFEEVPQAAPKDFTGLRVALRLSIPVFVAPAHGSANAEVAWALRWLANGQLELAATNNGSGHLQITDFEAQFPGSLMPLRGVTSKYVLPGSRMSWTLTPPADATKQGAIPIHGHSDRGDFSADVAPSDL